MDSGVTPSDFGIVSPPLGCRTFTAEGVTFSRCDTLPLVRHRMLEKLITEMQFDASYRGLVATFNKGWADLEAGRLGSGITAFGLMREKLNLIGANRFIPAEIVGLWYLAEGERVTEFDYEQFREKVYGPAFGALDRDWLKKKAYDLLLNTESRYPSQPEPENESLPPEA